MNGLRENTCFHVAIWAIRSLPPNSSSPSEAGCKRGGDGGFSLMGVCLQRHSCTESQVNESGLAVPPGVGAFPAVRTVGLFIQQRFLEWLLCARHQAS